MKRKLLTLERDIIRRIFECTGAETAHGELKGGGGGGGLVNMDGHASAVRVPKVGQNCELRETRWCWVWLIVLVTIGYILQPVGVRCDWAVVLRHWDGVCACELKLSFCRGCNCDVIICTWEGQNVGGLLSEREWEGGGGWGRTGGRSDDGNGWSKGNHVKCYSIYDLGWYVGGRTWLVFRHSN